MARSTPVPASTEEKQEEAQPCGKNLPQCEEVGGATQEHHVEALVRSAHFPAEIGVASDGRHLLNIYHVQVL